MKEQSEYSFRNNLVSNIKYWLLGNFISLNVGWAVLILICISVCFFPKYHYMENSNITFVFVCFGPFVGALLIKFIKKNMPWYFYITTGLIYGITFYCFILSVDDFINHVYNSGIKKALYDLSFNKEDIIQSLHDYSIILKVMFTVLIASLLGGFIVDIYRYFKGRNSERNYS